jgi:hypothetical protein
MEEVGEKPPVDGERRITQFILPSANGRQIANLPMNWWSGEEESEL